MLTYDDVCWRFLTFADALKTLPEEMKALKQLKNLEFTGVCVVCVRERKRDSEREMPALEELKRWS